VEGVGVLSMLLLPATVTTIVSICCQIIGKIPRWWRGVLSILYDLGINTALRPPKKDCHN